MTEKELESVATRFRAIGEVSRLKLVFAAGQGEKNVTELTTVRFRSPVNIDDFRFLVMGKWVEVEPAPVKWAFSQKA